MELTNQQTIRLEFRDQLCLLRFNRPEKSNAINRRMIEECHEALDLCLSRGSKVLVFQGSAEVFCTGADFAELSQLTNGEQVTEGARLYSLWRRMTEEAVVTVSQVRGRAAAGGMGFVGASDIVIAEPTASFALTELLFGLFPACVLPFLARRVGFQRAHYMTLTTRPVSAEVGMQWGLVDDYGADSDDLLRRHFLRLGRMSRAAVRRYKLYSSRMYDHIREWERHALAASREMFDDEENRRAIAEYAAGGVFPWESERSAG
ncbi:MAG TPA: enoyl-CoA hydratase/isomerase [Pyrinomonadaceae bacterium]